jgi:hypothetical protein
MLTDDEHRATLRHAAHQRSRTKVAIFNPEVIRLDMLEHLCDQAALLGMAILVQKDIGNHTTWKVMSQISDTLENSCFEINGLRKRP